MLRWRARHDDCAADFVAMLMRIRKEGAQRFQVGFWGLWQAAEALEPVTEEQTLTIRSSVMDNGHPQVDPQTSALHSGFHLAADLVPVVVKVDKKNALQNCTVRPYEAVSERWLLSFEAMARLLQDEHAAILESRSTFDQAEAYRRLVSVLSAPLASPLSSMQKLCPNGSPFSIQVCPLGLSRAVLAPHAVFVDWAGAGAVLPFVWLPLAMYVRSTTHLYVMLERMQYVIHQERHRAQNCESEPRKADANRIRAILDQDIRSYSYLVFAVTGALQALHLAKGQLRWRFPWSLMASSPPHAGKKQRNGYPMLNHWDFPESQLIFRGIWVDGDKVDEERARFQYSFQSFSREVIGMARVLSFYAGIEGSSSSRIAKMHGHLLILVARVKWNDRHCCALPVQLLEGPTERGSELEVLVPPYAWYELEEDLSMTSADFPCSGPSELCAEKLVELKKRWGGFHLPEMLLQMMTRAPMPEEFPEINAIRPFVSLRFVKQICLPEVVGELLVEEKSRLYDFAERRVIPQV